MLPKRVMDLPGWPPVGGSTDKQGDAFVETADSATVEALDRVIGKSVRFTCLLQGDQVFYTYFARNEKSADQFAAILKNSVGEVLAEVGLKEVPEYSE